MSRMAEIINRALVAKNLKVLTNVYETYDYSIFKEMNLNRDVTMSRVKKLIASFSEKEILNPIVVNEKMEIVDGQGRYEALKLLKRPIRFVVSVGATVEDCRRMNAYNTNWTAMDFVKSYAGSNNPNYVLFLKCQKETGLPFTKILRFAEIGEHKYHGSKEKSDDWTSSTVNSGKLIFTQEHFDKVAKTYKMMMEILDSLAITAKGGLDKFYTCIPIVFNYKGYNHERMVKKCKMCRSTFCLMASVTDMLTEFSRVYNYKTLSSEKLYFQDYMRTKGYNVRNYEQQSVGGYDSLSSAKTLVARSKS